MARRKRPGLVAEIGRLLVEYPERDWRALADSLRDRALIEALAAAVDDAVELVERSKEASKKERPRPRVNELARIAREDKSKAAVLLELKSRLTDKAKIVTLADIRGFASVLGMKEKLASRREQAVNQIIHYLATRTTVEIEAALRTAVPVQKTPGQEFDRWVDLILGGGAIKQSQKVTRR